MCSMNHTTVPHIVFADSSVAQQDSSVLMKAWEAYRVAFENYKQMQNEPDYDYSYLGAAQEVHEAVDISKNTLERVLENVPESEILAHV